MGRNGIQLTGDRFWEIPGHVYYVPVVQMAF